jgi:glycosyltransferase involved in cell wall biosynthesis
LKILQVNNFHFPRGGSDRYFLELTQLLRDSGHDARTFSTMHELNTLPGWFAGEPVAPTETEGARSVREVLRFFYSRESKRKMQDILVSFQPEIVHLHIYYGQLTSSILTPIRDSGLPVVQTLHEFKLVCPTQGLFAGGHFCDACQGRKYWHAVVKRCNRGSVGRSLVSMSEAYLSEASGAHTAVDRFIAVSRYQHGQLTRLGVPTSKLSLLYHFGIPTTEPPVSSGGYFLFVGRIATEKGIGVLLDACAELGHGAPPVKVVGSGLELQHWRTYAEERGLSEHVQWLGYKTGTELDKLYAGCLALINPSVLNETFGLTCLESLAHGRPVIASKVGGIPEVVDDGVDGVLIEPNSSAALRIAMERLSTDRDVAMAMGRRGWAKVRHRFSKQKHYEELLRIYGEVMG